MMYYIYWNGTNYGGYSTERAAREVANIRRSSGQIGWNYQIVKKQSEYYR